MKKILVTGTRTPSKGLLSIMREVFKAMAIEHPEVLIIHGACRGVDLYAEELARKHELEYAGFPARWSLNRRGGGVIRNGRMLVAHPDVDLGLAFHDDLENSTGTKDMTRRLLKIEVPVLLYENRKGRFL